MELRNIIPSSIFRGEEGPVKSLVIKWDYGKRKWKMRRETRFWSDQSSSRRKRKRRWYLNLRKG